MLEMLDLTERYLLYHDSVERGYNYFRPHVSRRRRTVAIDKNRLIVSSLFFVFAFVFLLWISLI